MTDHANELRRHARKIPHPQGETPGVMLRAADEIERLAARLEAAERDRANFLIEMGRLCAQCDALRAKVEAMEQQEPVELNFVELRNSAQKIVESYICFRRFIANTPLENDIAALMACFVFAQLDAKGE